MADKIFDETTDALKIAWDLQLPDTVSREAIIKLLAQRAMQLLDRNPEHFFQLMYKLDIPEKKLNAVLYSEDAGQQVGALIYERQLQRIQSRHTNKPPQTSDDPELTW